MNNDETPDDELTGHEPSRSRRWKVAISSILIVLVCSAPVVYRHWRLWHVPDIGHPFLVSEILKQIPEEKNAFPIFASAFALGKPVAETDFQQYMDEFLDDGWDSTDIQLNKYLEMNRPALEKWQEATEKDDYQFVPIARISDESDLTRIQAHRNLVRWCQVEIERLTKTGNPSGALVWLRASFRCSGLMTRRASWMDRLWGESTFSISAHSAEKWMQQPGVTADELLELLAVIQATNELTEKPSNNTKVEYLISRQWYAKWSYDDRKNAYEKSHVDPPLRSRWEAWLLAEPEFSQRLIAHMTANHLAFVDDPRREHPPVLGDDFFDESVVCAAPVKCLPARQLIDVLKDAKLINFDKRHLLSHFLESIDRGLARRACLQVAIAAQAYYRNRSKFPDRLADLQPDYLSSLPVDPYAPRPIPVIYRRTEYGVVVYSRFTNEIDDGGTTITYDDAPRGNMPDFGIRIRTPHGGVAQTIP